MEEQISDLILRNQELWYALLLVAPLDVDAVIVKTLSQKDMPPSDVLKPVPTESRPKVAEEKPSSIYSTPYRRTQLIPSLIDIEEHHIELVDNSTGKGANGVGWGEQGHVQNRANARQGLLISLSSSDRILVGLGEICRSPSQG